MPNYPGPALPTIDSEYVIGRNEAITRDNPNTATFIARTMQQQHDYFVQKFLDAQASGMQLDAKDMEEYELAMLRERQGIVNPLR
jgi:hypothetical protein